jgi:hypothetical protein
MLNHTDVAIDIHADGGPTWGRGFTVLEPVTDGPNDKIIASSVRFGRYVHRAFLAGTPLRASDYYGHDGYKFRADLAGLNLTTVPKVLIECGSAVGRRWLLTSPQVQRKIARATEPRSSLLTGRWPSGRKLGERCARMIGQYALPPQLGSTQSWPRTRVTSMRHGTTKPFQLAAACVPIGGHRRCTIIALRRRSHRIPAPTPQRRRVRRRSRRRARRL